MIEIKLETLKELSRNSVVTVKLDEKFNYRIAHIARDGFYVLQDKAFINGKKAEVKIRESFIKVYPHILTVKCGRMLVAEKRNGQLIATKKFERQLADEKGM